VVILHRFLAQTATFFLAEHEPRGGSGFRGIPLEPMILIIQQRLKAMRALTVRPSIDFHLQKAQIDADLQFLPAVGPVDPPRIDAPRHMRPGGEELRQVKAVHGNTRSGSIITHPDEDGFIQNDH
jgi:hypothetical protein